MESFGNTNIYDEYPIIMIKPMYQRSEPLATPYMKQYILTNGKLYTLYIMILFHARALAV